MIEEDVLPMMQMAMELGLTKVLTTILTPC